MGADKYLRTVIWNAFWKWVKSWKQNCKEIKKMKKHNITLVNDNLAFCTVCKGGEGELTTECCGRPLAEEERNRIYKIGNLDFINSKWTKK